MSLVVWLPLTKDLRNQGLSNVTSVGSPVFKNVGRLSNKSLDLNTRITFTCSTLANLTTFSVAFWAKVNDDTSLSTDWVDVIGFTDATSSGATGQLRWETCYSTNNKSRGISSHDNATYAISNGFGKLFCDKNVWVHLACTVDLDNGSVKEYVNGEHLYTFTTNGGHLTNTFWLGQTGAINGEIQDVRIYDHALSSMEVKWLSQGLVLHYPLSDAFLENTTNLITTEDCLSSTCFNGSTNKYGYGTNTDIYKTVTTFEGRKGTKVYMGTNGNNCYPYVYVNGMYTSNGTNSPEYKTLSFDYYTTVSTSICPYKLGSGTGTATYVVNANGIERTGTGTNSVVIPIIPNTWNHVEVTFHGTTDADAQWGYIQNQPAHVSDTNNFWFFANMQLEAKDHATGYAGVGGSRTINNMVYDNSGFCNNGISNNIIISNDTPKYKYSSTFNGTNSYIKVNDNNWMIKGMSEMTVNLWAKATTWPTNGGRLLSCTESGGFNLEGGNSGYWRFPIYVYTNSGQTSSAYKYDSNEIKIADLIPNEWNMITLVYDNTGTKTYLNGELHHTYTNTSYGINFNTNARLFLGCEANTASPYAPYFNGIESDFRIYATALSAEDVKSLYQNCATIDPDGTIRGQIRS